MWVSGRVAREEGVMSHGVLDTLKKASAGLLFPSETDAPFEPFVWKGEEGKPDKARVLELIGQPAGTRVKVVSLDSFFEEVTQEQDWHDDPRPLQQPEGRAELVHARLVLSAVAKTPRWATSFRSHPGRHFGLLPDRDRQVRRILAWAEAHRQRTGRWPTWASGVIWEAPGETWLAVDGALRAGARGLPGGSSLARLLARHRGVPNRMALPPLTEALLLSWADGHYRRTGRWPTRHAGPVYEEPRLTWQGVNSALQEGIRGLPGGSSLARLLARRRGVRNPQALPALRLEQILAWADAHRRRTGHWPTRQTGPIAEAPGETWAAVNGALLQGLRGLPGGSSLARLLAERRGMRNPKALPDLTVAQVLAWADAHWRRTGHWPRVKSGPIPEAPGETWNGVDKALVRGRRGFPPGSTLARLLGQHRPGGRAVDAGGAAGGW
jgi:hypothetical protein